MIGTDWLDSFNEYQEDDEEEEKKKGIKTRPAFPVSRQRDKSSDSLYKVTSSSSDDLPQIYQEPSQLLSQSNDETDLFEAEFSDPIDIGQIEEGSQKDFIDNPWTIAHRRAIAQRAKLPSNSTEFIERKEEPYDDTTRGERNNSKSTTFVPSSRRGQMSRNLPSNEIENISSSLQTHSKLSMSQPPLNFPEEDDEPEIEVIHQSNLIDNPYCRSSRFDDGINHPRSIQGLDISNFESDPIAGSETGTMLTHDRTTNTSNSAAGSEFDLISNGAEPLKRGKHIDRDEERRYKMRKTAPKLTRSLHQSKSHRNAKSILRPIKHLETPFKEVKTAHSMNLSSPLDQYMNQIPSTTCTSTSTSQSTHLKPIRAHPALSALYMPSNTLNEFRSAIGKQVDDEDITPVLKSRAVKSQPKRRSSISKRRKMLKRNSGLEIRRKVVQEPGPIDNISKRSISKNKSMVMKEVSKGLKQKEDDHLDHVVKDHGLESLTSERYSWIREMLEIQIRELDEWPSSDQVAEVLFRLALP